MDISEPDPKTIIGAVAALIAAAGTFVTGALHLVGRKRARGENTSLLSLLSAKFDHLDERLDKQDVAMATLKTSVESRLSVLEEEVKSLRELRELETRLAVRGEQLDNLTKEVAQLRELKHDFKGQMQNAYLRGVNEGRQAAGTKPLPPKGPPPTPDDEGD